MLRFTLRRDPYGRPSACADGPSGRDVDCRVHVCVRLVSAGDASVGAGPFRIGFRLGPPGHLADAQVFDSDDVEPARQVGTGLLHPVLAAVTGAGMQLGDPGLDPPAPVGTPTAPGKAALEVLESFSLTSRQPGTRQEFTSGQGRRYGHTAVQPSDVAGTRCRHRRRDDGEREVPATSPIAGHTVRLRRWNRARQAQPHPTDLGHQSDSPLPVQSDYPSGLRTDDAEPLVLPGLAPGRPPVSACKEVLDGLVEIAQRLLLHHLGSGAQPAERNARLGQLTALLDVSRRRTFVAGPHRPLLECQVPHVPRVFAQLPQRSVLCGSREHPEPGHATNSISQHRQFEISKGRQSWYARALDEWAFPRQLR